MTTAVALTFSQIKALAAAIRQKTQHGVIGLRIPGRWTGERVRTDGSQRYVIDQCDSPLAIRLALRRDDGPSVTKVIVTNLQDQDLGDDVLVRLAKRKLVELNCWQIVKSLFEAHSIDPRLSGPGRQWLPDTLLELVPADACPRAPGGFLDAEVVWPLLLSHGIGLTGERPDLPALLRWSLEPTNVARFRNISDAFRNAAIEWLEGVAGPSAGVVARCVLANQRPDALSIGLALGVIHHPQAGGKLDKAIGKIEGGLLGNQPVDADTVKRWFAAATEVVRWPLMDAKGKRQQLQGGDDILREMQADSFAWLSDTSPLGFDQRLARIGECLADVVRSGRWSDVEQLRTLREMVRSHDLWSNERRRIDRLDMALRLVRWLGQPPLPAPRSFAEAAAQYAAEGSFVDWARLSLRWIEPVRELSEAYSRLFVEVLARREQQSLTFGKLLQDWTAAGSTGDEVLPLEAVLSRLVAPLAAEAPVLLIVVDGMSMAVYQELLADLAATEWTPLWESGRQQGRPGIAVLPSVTEVSRTSLLCGQLRLGTQNDERPGFASHAGLLAASKPGFPPILFHKNALQASSDSVLAAEIRKEIGSSSRRVVGVVVNAVDDHLAKGDQIDTCWTREAIPVLPALLHEARGARRLVVLIADHGHVLDCQTVGRPHEGGDRWRSDNGLPLPDELIFSGHRVVSETHRLIAPVSEKLRYGFKKNGYHGGATPQEMVVPVTVLCSTDKPPAGWSEAGLSNPVWWDEPVAVHVVAPQLKPTKSKPAGVLFDLESDEAPPESTRIPAVDPVKPTGPAPWITALLASPVFTDQRKLGGRTVPTPEVFTKLLTALDERGGKLIATALARALGSTPMRLQGMLAVMQRVLNVDGYAVLTRDASDTVALDRDLLCRQFDL